jgi:CelD/BcsL family acetyltransferase involved in cellulose biosynthesis
MQSHSAAAASLSPWRRLQAARYCAASSPRSPEFCKSITRGKLEAECYVVLRAPNFWTPSRACARVTPSRLGSFDLCDNGFGIEPAFSCR